MVRFKSLCRAKANMDHCAHGMFSVLKPVKRGIFVLALLTSLTGCFYVTSPILSHLDGDPLPGGIGKFQVVSKKEEDRRIITVRESRSHPNEYTLAWNEDGETVETPAIFDHINEDIYVMQIQEDGKYIIIIASIDESGISYFDMDEDVTDPLLKDLDFAIVKMPLFGDKRQATKQIAAYLTQNKDFAISGIGLTLHGNTTRILHFARNMAAHMNSDQRTDGLLRLK